MTRYRWVAARKAEGFPTTLCCTVAGVSRQSFYLNPPMRWGRGVWRVHRKGLLTWEDAVVDNGHSGHVRRHFRWAA